MRARKAAAIGVAVASTASGLASRALSVSVRMRAGSPAAQTTFISSAAGPHPAASRAAREGAQARFALVAPVEAHDDRQAPGRPAGANRTGQGRRGQTPRTVRRLAATAGAARPAGPVSPSRHACAAANP